MSNNQGKFIHLTFSDAEKEAENLRRKFKEPFVIYKSKDGWLVGGAHLKKERKMKRINQFSDLKELFKDIEGNYTDADIENYYETISQENSSEKISESSGDENNWILESVEILKGNLLGMHNTKLYLTLFLTNSNGDKLRLKMGGAFESSIQLIHRQALSLLQKPIIWHTWNSKYKNNNQWSSDAWFYLIEEKK